MKFRMAAAPQALRERTGFVLNRAALLFRQRSAAKLGELGLTLQEYAILCCLAEYGPSSQKNIASCSGIDPSDLVAVLDRLQEEVHVFRERDVTDQRLGDVRITDGGEGLITRASELLNKVEMELLSGLSVLERLQLRELATRIIS